MVRLESNIRTDNREFLENSRAMQELVDDLAEKAAAIDLGGRTGSFQTMTTPAAAAGWG